MELRLLRPPRVASTSWSCSRTHVSVLPRCFPISKTSKDVLRCRMLVGKRAQIFVPMRASAFASGDETPPPPPPPSPPPSPLSDLPIAQVIPQCLSALERGHLVLEAPPGAGKTTALPLELLAADPPWLRGKALVVVEPRRLAAKAAARRMVSLLSESSQGGERLRLGKGGCPIGYAVRGDARCSFGDARVVVVTPGVATRLLLEELSSSSRREGDDGYSDGDGNGESVSASPLPRRRRGGGLFAAPIGAVMLDEAHERSAEVDLLFALLAAAAVSAGKKSGGGGESGGGESGGGESGGGGTGTIKVVFASATLGGGLAEKAAARLGGDSNGDGVVGNGSVASVVRAPAAKSFPVAVRFAGPPRDAGGGGGGARGRSKGGGGGSSSSLAAAAAAEAVALLKGGAGAGGSNHARGDVLVFLPGVADIRATRAALETKLIDNGEGEGGGGGRGRGGNGGGGGGGTEILSLHGGLPPAEQDRVLSPASSSSSPAARKRRIILSTPVAESSLTVPGVTAVVDSGLSRVPRLDPSKGVEKLVTLPVSQSSASQRAGRAGREAPGACVRLWSEGDHARRPAAAAPEVSRGGSDLAPLALALVAAAAAGDSLASHSSRAPSPPLPWLDEPHRGDLSAALELLELLGLISRREGEVNEDSPPSSCCSPPPLHRAFELTPAGRQACALGAHPRLSRMLLCAARLRCPELGAVLAAVCSERDFIIRNRRSTTREGGAGGARENAAPAPAPGASAVERVLALAGRGPMAAIVDRRGAAGVLDAAAVLERQLKGVVAAAAAASADESEEEEDDEEPVLDDGDGGGDGDEALQEPQRFLRRGERRLALARAAAGAIESSHPSLVGALIASAYPDRVATRRARGGRDRSAAFVLGGGGDGGGRSGSENSSPATAVLPAGSLDPLMDRPVLAVATLGTSAAAARSSSLIFLAAPLELRRGRSGGESEEGKNAAAAAAEARAEEEEEEILRAIPGLLVSGERKVVWVPSAARLVCSERTRVGGAVVEERALDATSEVSDDEAGRAFAEAAARRGGGLAALREPTSSRAWRKLVSKVAAAAEGEEGEKSFKGSSSAELSDLGGEGASPAALEALLPALRKCRTAADLEALEWERLLSEALLSPEQAEVVDEWRKREEEEKGASSSGSSSGARSSPAGKAGKKKGRPKR